MTITDGFMIAAVILGPILAVQAQKWIESWKQAKERKLWVFKTLIASLGTPLSPAHVQALNVIDLEFSDKNPKEKAVLEAWKIYHSHLNDFPRDHTDPAYQTKIEVWNAKTKECLVDTLYAMSQALGYSFDKVKLEKGAYTPQAHGDLESDLFLLRRGLIDTLYGKRPLPVIAFSPPPISQETVNPLGDVLRGTLKK